MAKKRLSPDQLQASNYNTAIATPSGIPPDKQAFLEKLSGINPTYGDEYSPSPLIPQAGSAQRVDFGTEGFNERLGAGMLPEENPQDVYAKNQTGFEQFYKGLERIGLQTPVKMAQGAAFLGSGIGEMLFGWMGDGSVDIDDIVNNPLTKVLADADQTIKDNIKIYKPSNWDDKSFFQQAASSAWWADEGADGAAFALSALLPAGWLGKLGIGKGIVGGLEKIGALNEGSAVSRALTLSKAGLINPIKMAGNVDAIAQNAFMTTSEALFEAKDTGDSLTRDYLKNVGVDDVKQLTQEQADDLNTKKADAMRHTFFANLAALSGSNAIEIGLLNKIIGKSTSKLVGELAIAPEMIENPVSRVARKGLDKFFNNTKTGFTLKTIGTQMGVEGLYEENIQQAIQNVSQNMALNGKIDNLNYIGEVLKETATNLGDKEAWKSIGAGMVIGGLFGGVGGVSTFNREQDHINSTVGKLNAASNNFLKIGDIYKKNEDGTLQYDEQQRPIVDTEKLQVFMANSIQANNIAKIHDYYKTKGENELADVAKNELVTNYVKSFMEAGLEDEMKERVKSWSRISEDDLVKAGFDPVELDQRSQPISKEQRLSALQEKINDLSNQYKVITRTIPETEGARVGETLSWYSRAKHLKGLNDRLEQRKTELAPEVLTSNSLVSGINLLARKYQQIERELPQVEKFSLPIRAAQLRKEQELIGQELLQTKLDNKEELKKLGIDVGENLEEISMNKTPAQTEFEGIEQTQVQVKNALNDATDKYNQLIDRKGGEQFYKDLQDKVKSNIETQEGVNDILDVGEGDYVEVKNKVGQTSSGFVTRNDSGNLVLGNTEINTSDFRNKFTVTKYTPEQIDELRQQKVEEYRKTQLGTRIEEKLKQLQTLLSKVSKGEDRLLQRLIEKEEVLNNENSSIRLSERQLAKQLKDLEKSIAVGEEYITDLQDQIENLNNEITELRYLYDTPESIQDVQELITKTEADIIETEKKISILQPIVDKLKSTFGSMLNMWNKLFPNKEYSLEDKDYTDYKQDFDLTRAELKQASNDLDNLNEAREFLYSELIDLNNKLKEYQLEANKLDYIKPLRPEVGQEEGDGNIVTTGKDGEKDTSFNSIKTKDISTGLLTTTGNHKVALEKAKEGNKQAIAQLRWFKFAEGYIPTSKANRLRTVTINDEEYGVGKPNDIFKDDDEQYKHEKHVKVLVVDKQGNPIRRDGELVFTSLIEAKDSLSEYKYSDGNPMFSNTKNLSSDAIQKQINDYKDFINAVKAKPQFLDIKSRSNGVVRTGFLQSIKKVFGTNDIELKVITDKSTVIGERGFPLKEGLVYAIVKARPVGLIVRKLIPTEIDAVLKKLKEYSEIRGKKEGNGPLVLKQITSVIPLIKRNVEDGEVDRSFYFLKGEDKLVFGDNIISTSDLIEGKFDEQLTQFLSDLNHHVDNKQLNKKEEFRDIYDNKWSSYKDYLTQDKEDAPLQSNVYPYSDDINEPQFYSTYLSYSAPKENKEQVTKTPKGKFGQNLDYVELTPSGLVEPAIKDVADISISDIEPVGNFPVIGETGEITNKVKTVTVAGGVSIPIDELEEIKQLRNDTREKIAPTTSESTSNGTNEIEKTTGTNGGLSKEGITNENEQDKKLDILDTFDTQGYINNQNLSTATQEEDFDLLGNRVQYYEKIDANEEIEVVKKLLPSSVTYGVIKSLIDNKSFGRFTRNAQILISEMATKGTTYHEAFHAVVGLFLKAEEKEALFAEWRKNNPSRETDIGVEEQLAEEFREYALTKDSIYSKWFKPIVDFIKGLLGMNSNVRDSLFKSIMDGGFKNAEIIDRPLRDMDSVFNGMGATVRKDIFDGMTVTLLQSLFKNGFDINDIRAFNKKELNSTEANSFANIQNDTVTKIVNTLEANSKGRSNEKFIKDNLVPFIKANRAQIISEHIDYLKQYNITLRVEDSLDFNDSIPDSERSRDTFGIIDAIEFNTKSGMPSAVKMMIASLPKAEWVNGETKLVKNNLGLLTTTDYRRNVAILHNTLAGISDYERQIEEVQKLVEKIPEFKYLLQRLDTGDTSTQANAYLQLAFREQFDKAKYNFHIQIYDGNNSYLSDANSTRLGELIKANWQGKLRTNKQSIKSVDGQEVLNKEYFKKYESNEGDVRKNVLSFYKDMGITFSNPEEVSIDVLADTMQALLKHIDKEVTTSSDIFSIDGIQGYLNRILEQEIKTSNDYSDNQHINPEGKTVYSISLNDYITIVTNNIKENGLPEHLQWDEKKKSGNPFIRNSIWIVKIASGKVLSGSEILEGARRDIVGEQGKNTSALNRAETAVQQFTAVLNGVFPFLRAGDKKLEKAFTFGEKANEYKIQEATDIFKGYLADELLTSWLLNVEGLGSDIEEYKEAAKSLRVFSGLFDEKVIKPYVTATNIDKKQAIRAIDKFVSSAVVLSKIQEYLESKVKDNTKELIDNGIVKKIDSKYINIGLPSELIKTYLGVETEMSEGQLKTLVEQFTYNSLIANIEQTKMFTGDIAFYKNFFKRTSGPVGTGKTAATGEYINKLLNNLFPRADKKSDGKISTWVFNDVIAASDNYNDYVKAFIDYGFTETETKNILKDYLRTNEADAQGFMTLPEYREFVLRTSGWNNDLEIVYQKAMNKEKLTKDDVLKLVAKKPQYFGTQESNGLFVPTFYKLSVAPLIPSVIAGRNLERLNQAMLDNGRGISVFVSGVKTGARGLQSVYNEKGEINIANVDASHVLDYKYMKMQLEIAPEIKDKVTFGSQFRKLILSGLFNKSLTIGKKLVSGKDIINEYNSLINKQVRLETNKLIKRLGIERDGSDFKITNTQALRDLLKEEGHQRSSPLNLIEGLDKILKDGNILPLELSVGRNKLEQILFSLVDKSIIKQKVFGDMNVQVASTGFETKARKQSDINKEAWASNLETLKAYKPTEGDTEPMEVYLPHKFSELFGRDVDITKIDKRLRELVGFRIPTQGLNFIDAIRIKSFLPEEAGNIVVVPTEIVTKSGTDFDIDKLNLFFPNYKYNKEIKLPEYIEYTEGSEDTDAIQNRIIELSRQILLAKENFTQLVSPSGIRDLNKVRNELTDLDNSLKPDEDDRSRFVDWVYNLGIKETYTLGIQGVGPSALQNVHHILTQQAEVKMKNAEVYLNHHTDENSNADLSQENLVNSDTPIQDIISQTVSGFVDIANDTVLKTLNITIDTANTFFFLTRIGTPLKQSIYFLNQPIIRDYLRQLSLSNSIFLGEEGTESLTVRREKVKKGILEKYKGGQDTALGDIEDQADWMKLLTVSNLADYIRDKGKDKAIQRQILEDYIRYEQYGQQLSDLVNASTFDTNGTRGNLESARTAISKFLDIVKEDNFVNADKLLSETFLGSFAEAVGDSIGMYKDLFLTEKPQMRTILNRIKDKVKHRSANDVNKIMTLAKNDLIQYVFQQGKINGIKTADLIKNYFTEKGSIPGYLALLKDEGLDKTNYLVRELVPILSKSTKTNAVTIADINNIKLFNKRLTPEESNIITDAWRDGLEHQEEGVRQFFHHLATFAILQSGLNNSQLSFTQFIPNEVYFNLMSSIIDNSELEGLNITPFEQLFLNNNRRNNLLMTKAYSSDQIQSKSGENFILSKRQGDWIKKWSKTLNDYRIFQKDESYEGKTNKFVEQNRKGAGDNFKEYHTGTSVLVGNNIVKEDAKSLAKELKVNKRSELVKRINESDFNDAFKKDLIERTKNAKTPEEIGNILKELC